MPKYTPSAANARYSNATTNTPALRSYRRISSLDSPTPSTAPSAAPMEADWEALAQEFFEGMVEAGSEVDWEAVAQEFFEGMVAAGEQGDLDTGSEAVAAALDVQGSLSQWWDLTSQSLWLDFQTKQLPAIALDFFDAGATLAAAPITFPLKMLDAAIAGTRSAAAGWAFGAAATNHYAPEMDWRKRQALKSVGALTAFAYGSLTTMFNPKLKLFSQLKTQYNATVPLYTTGKIDTLKVASATPGTLVTESGLSLVTGGVKGELKELVKTGLKNLLPARTSVFDTVGDEVIDLIANTAVTWFAGSAIDSTASAASIGGKLASSRLGYGDYTLKKADEKTTEVDTTSLVKKARLFGRNQLKAITGSGFTAAAGGIAGMAEGGAAFGTRAASAFVTALGETAKTTTSTIGDKNFDPMITVGNELMPGRHDNYNLADLEKGNLTDGQGTFHNLIPAPQLAPPQATSSAPSYDAQEPVAGPSGQSVPQIKSRTPNLSAAIKTINETTTADNKLRLAEERSTARGFRPQKVNEEKPLTTRL